MPSLDVSQLPPELRDELEKRFRLKAQAKEAQGFLAELHPEQRKFIDDPAKRKAALCGRRAGKSFLILAWLIEGALTDQGGFSVYVARSKGDARRILGPAIVHFQQRWPQLELEIKEQDGQLLLRVGCCRHVIWLAGAKDQSQIGKFRGGKYRRVAIDEAQEYGSYLKELIRDVFEPALIDKQGDLALCGTPSVVPAGLFYEATTGDGSPKWSTHSWDLYANPHLPDPHGVVAAYCAQYGITKDSNSYIREYLGKWVKDAGALVYPYSFESNAALIDDVPAKLSYVLGIDVGFVDATAFCVASTSPLSPNIYILEAWKREHMTPSAVAAVVKEFLKKYGRGLRVVVDTGGIGKAYAEELRLTHAIGCEPAEKTKKRAYQEFTSGALKAGTIKIVSQACQQLIDEMCVCQWGPGRLAEDDRFENHCLDALLYSTRAIRNHYREPLAKPAPGSDEWNQAERLKMRSVVQSRVKLRNKGKGWGSARK